MRYTISYNTIQYNTIQLVFHTIQLYCPRRKICDKVCLRLEINIRVDGVNTQVDIYIYIDNLANRLSSEKTQTEPCRTSPIYIITINYAFKLYLLQCDKHQLWVFHLMSLICDAYWRSVCVWGGVGVHSMHTCITLCCQNRSVLIPL